MGLLGFVAEQRKFSPSYLARIRSPWDIRSLLQKAEEYAEGVKNFGEIKVVSIELMQSELRPQAPNITFWPACLSGLPAVLKELAENNILQEGLL